MSNETNFDVVIIGGGIAGLATANRAAQQGLKVAVLERGQGPQYLCNSRYSGGVLHIAMHNAKDPPESLMEVIKTATNGKADPELARALATTAGRAIDWLQSEGAKYIRVGNIVWQQHVLAPPRPIVAGLDWKGRGPDVTLRQLVANLQKRGGRLIQTPALSLMEREGRCVGVEAGGNEEGANKEQFTARAVVLADGGYQGNAALVREHMGIDLAKVKTRGAGTGIGDGMRMARELDARFSDLQYFYGHMLSRDAFTNDKVWPYPQLDELGTVGIVVNDAGERFVDEGQGGVFVANTIARLPNPLSTWAILDEAIWAGPGRTARIPANPQLANAGGTIIKAATLAELAAKTGIAREPLERTVAAYNAALANNTLAQLAPARSDQPIKPAVIAKPPYYAVPICAGMTYTFGGIFTDGDARVMSTRGAPIEGLYAVGATTGGLEGGVGGGGYVGGLIKGVSFGMRAAEHIAQTLKG
ncbi:MAG: FAD-dependent oxidoreductase [Betaproteobacteria bacterium]|nr:FAD-dependent oxidoreductase [Betaproteobacteria bacterium]